MEMVEPASIGVDTDTAPVPETLMTCLQLLGAIAPDSTRNGHGSAARLC
jgi:hypothetical protein